MSQNKVIRILFLSANPRGTPRLDLDNEFKSIYDTIQRSNYRDSFDMRSMMDLWAEELDRHILHFKPQILHFSGHGEKDGLILAGKRAGGKRSPIRPVADLFRILMEDGTVPNTEKIRCVVLNACFSEPQAKAIAQYVDCVIGNSDSVLDEAAIAFAEAFYLGLGEGKTIKTAFDLGKRRIAALGLPGSDLPRIETKNGVDPSKYFIKSIDEPVIDTTELTDVLSRYFSQGFDLRRLCGRLQDSGIHGAKYDSLKASTVDETILNIVEYCKARAKIPVLISAAIAERPAVEEIRNLNRSR
jgi:hypothetical protein